MTETIILRRKSTKKIEFVKAVILDADSFTAKMIDVTMYPSSWACVALLGIDYSDGLDLMFAWDGGERGAACLYLGHWNDGEV